MSPMGLFVHRGVPSSVLIKATGGRPRVSNGLLWVAPAASLDEWTRSVPPNGGDLGNHLYHWLYS